MKKATSCAVLCAAGLSSRMGTSNKLLMPYDTGTIISHALDQLLAASFSEIIVVLGHEHRKVMSSIQHYDEKITVVVNKAFETGHLSTIQTGIRHVNPGISAIAICLSDMPLLTGPLYDEILHFFEHEVIHDQPGIVRPLCGKRPGHPVIISSDLAEEFLHLDPNEKARSFIRKRKEILRPYPSCHPGYFTDIDTPKDFDSFIKRFGQE